MAIPLKLTDLPMIDWWPFRGGLGLDDRIDCRNISNELYEYGVKNCLSLRQMGEIKKQVIDSMRNEILTYSDRVTNNSPYTTISKWGGYYQESTTEKTKREAKAMRNTIEDLCKQIEAMLPVGDGCNPAEFSAKKVSICEMLEELIDMTGVESELKTISK